MCLRSRRHHLNPIHPETYYNITRRERATELWYISFDHSPYSHGLLATFILGKPIH
jgi:hypothetical protein